MDKSKEPIEKCNAQKSTKPGKVFLKAFFIAGLITLATKSYHTIVETQDRIWREYQSPYDTKNEFWKLRWTSRLRVGLTKYGLNHENFIQKLLTNFSEATYLSAKAKIPEGDIALGEYIFMHKYIPLMHSKDTIITPYDKEDILDFVNELLNKKSKADSFNKIHRLDIADTIVFWFQFKAPDSVRAGMGNQLLELTNSIIGNMNFYDFMKLNYNSYYRPIAVHLNKFGIDNNFLQLHGCNDNDIKAITNDIGCLDNLLKLYKESPLVEDGRDEFSKNTETYYEMKSRIKLILQNKCKIKIGK